MYLTKKTLAVMLASCMATTSIGCGQSFKSSGTSSGSSTSAQAVDISDQMQKAADASVQAQSAMDEANAAIATIMDSNGKVKLSVFQSSASSSSQVGAQGLLQPLIDKLNLVFDKVFAKIDSVKSQFTLARGLLADALAKLTASNPAQAAQIEQIKAQLAKIDALELQFRNAMHMLASKLDLATTALDRLMNTATSFIPVPGLGMVAGVLLDMFVMGDVKNLIATVKARLMSV